MRRDLALLAVVLVSLLLAVAFFPRPAKKAGLISQSTLERLELGPNGEVKTGLWSFVLVVDRYDTLRFTLKPDNVPVSSAQSYTGPELPSGSTLNSRRGIELVLSPQGNPWTYGTMKVWNWVYNDGSDNYRTWSYYAMEGKWDYILTPYTIQVKEYPSGTLLAEKTVLAGPSESGIAQDTVTGLPYNIKVSFQGYLSGGVTWPSSDFAYIYDKGGGGRYVSRNQLESKLLGVPGAKLGKGQVTIKLSSASPQGNEQTDSYYYKTVDWPGYRTWMYVTQATGETAQIQFKHTQDALFGSQDFVWTFQVTNSSPGFYPEEVSFSSVGEAGSGDWWNLIDASGNRVPPNTWTPLSSEKTFRFKYHGEDGTHDFVTVTFYFRGPADTWDEVVQQTGVTLLEDYKPQPSIVTSASGVVGVPTDWRVWDPERVRLYSSEVPKEQSGHFPGAIYSTGAADPTVICKLSPQIAYPLVTVEVPIDAFDSWVYIPPYGKPQIVGVDATKEATGGGQVNLAITVKNVGLTKDTFTLEKLTEKPPELVMGSTTEGTKYIDKDQQDVLRYTFNVGKVEQEHTATIKGTIIAKGSGLTDEFSATVTLKPGSGPVVQTGDLEVTVVDKETGASIAGATVKCAVWEQITDPNGKAIFSALNTGKYTVTVEAKGYYKTSRTAEVTVGTNYLTVELSKSKPHPIPWKWIAVAVALSAAVGIGLYAWRRRRK
jgi:hypothetical protein